MARSPLQTLLRLRHTEVDAARAELMACEMRVQNAALAEQAARAAIVSEMAVASTLTSTDAAVEAFGAWLPIGRAAVTRAEATLSRSEDEAVQSRACLNLARAAAEAVEKLLEKQAEEAAKEALRREQVILDEAGQRPRQRR